MQDSSRYIRGCHHALSVWARKLVGALGRKPRPQRHRVGRWGERIAADYLRRAGVTVVKTNWKAAGLEADIIAVERKTIVILEVKTRHHSQRRHYPAIGAINREKRRHLDTLARAFMRNHAPLCRRIGAKHHRVDAVEVYYVRGRWGLLKTTTIRRHKGLPSPLIQS